MSMFTFTHTVLIVTTNTLTQGKPCVHGVATCTWPPCTSEYLLHMTAMTTGLPHTDSSHVYMVPRTQTWCHVHLHSVTHTHDVTYTWLSHTHGAMYTWGHVYMVVIYTWLSRTHGRHVHVVTYTWPPRTRDSHVHMATPHIDHHHHHHTEIRSPRRHSSTRNTSRHWRDTHFT